MTDDLVKRLRDYEEYEQSRDGQIVCVKSDMAQEAATYIEQLEAEVRELNMQVLASGSQAQEAYEAQLKAEAATAAAYEVSAKAVAEARVFAEDDTDGETAAKVIALGRAGKAIRALATPDQTAALDRLIAEAEARTVERIAELVSGWRNTTPMTGEECATAILAASKKGGA